MNENKLKSYLAKGLIAAMVLTTITSLAPILANEATEYDEELLTEVDRYVATLNVTGATLEVEETDVLVDESNLEVVDESISIEDDGAYSSAYAADVDEIEAITDAKTENDETEEVTETPIAHNAVIASGTIWGGAPWTLDDQGIVMVGGGTIQRGTGGTTGPWHAHRYNIREIVSTEPVVAINSIVSLFAELSYLERIEGLDLMDVSQVVDMLGVFRNTTRLAELDVSNWDVSRVVRMDSMFRGAASLTTVDVSNWDVSQVRGMWWMFGDASSLVSLDVSNWDTSSVLEVRMMFDGASSLVSLDVSNWDMSQVTAMNSMFRGTSSLVSLDVSNWDVSQVMTMGFMFADASSLIAIDVSNWDVSSLNNTGSMFFRSTSLQAIDLSNWDMSGIRYTYRMFGSAVPLRSITLGPGVRFPNNPHLLAVPQTEAYTGHWQHIGTGTIENPNGPFVFTSAQLWQQFDGETMAGTFVWQPRESDATPLTHTVTFYLHGGAGDFPTQTIESGQFATAPTATPTRAGYRFMGWFTTANGDVAFDFEAPITANAVAHAQWERVTAEPAPTEPEPTTPTEPTPTTPTEPEPTTPTEPTPTTPTEPEPTTPTEPEPTTPTEPEPTTPAEPELATPTEPELATPTEPEPTTPTEPELATPTEPEPTTPTEPVLSPEVSTPETAARPPYNNNLPQTGAMAGSFVLIGSASITAGVVVAKKRKKS